MKRVGILTLFYRTYNFGAQLQAYALQQTIQRMGYECEQIRFAWSTEQTRFNYDTASVDQAAFEAFAQRIPHSRRVYTPEDIQESNSEYDIFVCGSDQIWGVRESMPTYVLPQMMLSFARKDKKRIAYGASFGSADIAENRKEILRCFLDGLDFLSMRERSAVPYLEGMTEKPVLPVVDPVMLLTGKEWSGIGGDGRPVHPKEPYILLYNVSCNGELRQAALDLAAGKGIQLINLAYAEGMAIGPCEFVSLIEHAAYVITDSFHGSVLSVLFHKRFITFGVDTIDTPYSKNTRAKDMLGICGLDERFFQDIKGDGTRGSWQEILDMPVDYRDVDQKVSEASKASMEYLRNALCQRDREETCKASQLLYRTVVKTGNCTGCTACTNCARSCVRMEQDELGFHHPIFDDEGCMDCGQCLQSCPVYSAMEQNREERRPLAALALQAKSQALLEKSSSGGAFYVIAERMIEEDGVVCGAVYGGRSGFEVVHRCAETKRDLERFRKSKYVQSDLNHVFADTEQYLKKGRKVLFTGTPCQVAGLKAYLQGDHENLYTIDLICGGVTSPLLWEKYASYYSSGFGTEGFDMRFKGLGFFQENGRLAFSISHKRQDGECFYEKDQDLFLSTRMAFYNESCYACRFKGDCHEADLTIGDFVGFPQIAPQEDNHRGMSLVLVRNKKGEELLRKCKADFVSSIWPYEAAAARNDMIRSSMKKPAGSDYLRGIAPSSSMEKLCYEARLIRLFREKETIFRNFLTELKRSELLSKIKRYAVLQCKLEYDPMIQGRIVIYGAGKIGRALLDCIEGAPLCFLDRSDRIRNVSGHPVYHPDSAEFRKLKDENRMTVLVTPVWDYWEIREQLVNVYPRLNIVSVEKVVEKIWE